jgi:hypothetical protein
MCGDHIYLEVMEESLSLSLSIYIYMFGSGRRLKDKAK